MNSDIIRAAGGLAGIGGIALVVFLLVVLGVLQLLTKKDVIPPGTGNLLRPIIYAALALGMAGIAAWLVHDAHASGPPAPSKPRPGDIVEVRTKALDPHCTDLSNEAEVSPEVDPPWSRQALRDRGWAALNAGDFPSAVAVAGVCVRNDVEEAKRDETALANAKVKIPDPLPNNTNSAVSRRVLARGVLNDVAACGWILGESSMAMHRWSAARESYSMVAYLKHARIWDPEGGFWDPSMKAGDRLADLNKRCPS